MFLSIKRIIEMNKNMGKIKESLDDEGRLVVNMTVRDDSNFVSPFSYDGEPILSNEVAEFLNSSIRPSKFKSDIHLNIHSNVIDEKEKEVYKEAIQNYYHNAYVNEKQKINRNLALSFFMLLASILFLVLLVVLEKYISGNILIEIIDIIAWVFMWEAADIFFLQQQISRWTQHRNITFYKARVTFLPLEKV